jgi:methionine salvage enolase-phosphatase E1
MTALWMVALAALAIALAAWVHARRTARQLRDLTQMFWQLKFDHGELKARVDPAAAPAAAAPKQTFVPLSSVRKPGADTH